jgi:hypothetical protein
MAVHVLPEPVLDPICELHGGGGLGALHPRGGMRGSGRTR